MLASSNILRLRRTDEYFWTPSG